MANIGVCFEGCVAWQDIPLATKDGRRRASRVRKESKCLTRFFAKVKDLAREKEKGTK